MFVRVSCYVCQNCSCFFFCQSIGYGSVQKFFVSYQRPKMKITKANYLALKIKATIKATKTSGKMF